MSARQSCQCNNTEQVRVEPRPLAVSMALPTCADEHRAAAPRSPAVRDPAVSMLLLRCFNGTDGRTDARQLHRRCSANNYYDMGVSYSTNEYTLQSAK